MLVAKKNGDLFFSQKLSIYLMLKEIKSLVFPIGEYIIDNLLIPLQLNAVVHAIHSDLLCSVFLLHVNDLC